jgi:ATP-dependent Clp protease ATP-binding subunit ClpC
MAPILLADGQPNPKAFDAALLRQTRELASVVEAAAQTGSTRIESTHFLIALSQIPDGTTQSFFKSRGLLPSQLMEGLAGTLPQRPGAAPRSLTDASLDESARGLVSVLEEYVRSGKIEQATEAHVLLATLQNLTPAVAHDLREFPGGTLDPEKLHMELWQSVFGGRNDLRPFSDDSGALQLDAFSASGRRIFALLRAEAEALGYLKADPRHLLLALLEYEGSAAQATLYRQSVVPKRVQHHLMINLRARGSKTRSRLRLERDAMQPLLVRIIELASVRARADLDAIAAVHLWRAFLDVESFALRELALAGVDLSEARASAQEIRAEDEADPPGAAAMKSLAEIERTLGTALVGQAEAVAACWPYIRRLHFDFPRKGKPAGTFLFCGPSGVGKTELAKAIARAVFGTESELIMLEMGQFQTKESMNIFVGAPPAYVGYGEGKLTNGLRDKPRSVVLFDEVEKAHPEVFDALLRFIDEGQISDPAGPIRDGSQCIIVLTSNVRVDSLEATVASGGAAPDKWAVRRALRQALLQLPAGATGREPFRFRPEFLNRIDEIVLFRPLSDRDFTEIAARHIDECVRRFSEERGVDVTIVRPDKAAEAIGRFCSKQHEGARLALRVTQAAVVDSVIDFLCRRNPPPATPLQVQLYQDGPEGEPQGHVSLQGE